MCGGSSLTSRAAHLSDERFGTCTDLTLCFADGYLARAEIERLAEETKEIQRQNERRRNYGFQVPHHSPTTLQSVRSYPVFAVIFNCRIAGNLLSPVYEGSRTRLIACTPAQVDMLEDPKTVLERASRTDALRANLKRIEE